MTDKYWIGGTAQWQPTGISAAARWSPSGIPTATDNVILDASAGSVTITVSSGVVCANLITIGFTGVITGGASGIISVYGSNVNLGESEIFDPSRYPRLHIISGTTTTLTSNGQSLGDLSIDSGTTLQLNDDLTLHNNSLLYVLGGTFDANNKNVVAGTVTDNNTASAKTIKLGSGRWTLGADTPPGSTTGQYVWTISNPGQCTIDSTGAQPIRLMRYGGISRLRADITNTDSSIQLYGALVQGSTTTTWSSSGSIIIDNEQIQYTGLTSTSATDVTLTGCTRGLNGTTAVSHNKYSPVFLMSPTGYATLAFDMDSSSTGDITILGSNSGFGGASGSGYLVINGEVISFTSKPTSTTFGGITRGTTGTTATEHKAGEYVRAVEYRVFAGGDGLSYPTIESFSNDEYQMTDITGNGISISGVSYNYLGNQKITVNGTSYYVNEPGFTEDLLSLF